MLSLSRSDGTVRYGFTGRSNGIRVPVRYPWSHNAGPAMRLHCPLAFPLSRAAEGFALDRTEVTDFM